MFLTSTVGRMRSPKARARFVQGLYGSLTAMSFQAGLLVLCGVKAKT